MNNTMNNSMPIPNTRHTHPCLRKAHDDEPLFVIRSTDKNAPATVLHWIGLCAASGSPHDKLRATFEDFLQIVSWQEANPHLVKNPD